jgi:hypothetical protein
MGSIFLQTDRITSFTTEDTEEHRAYSEIPSAAGNPYGNEQLWGTSSGAAAL